MKNNTNTAEMIFIFLGLQIEFQKYNFHVLVYKKGQPLYLKADLLHILRTVIFIFLQTTYKFQSQHLKMPRFHKLQFYLARLFREQHQLAVHNLTFLRR